MFYLADTTATAFLGDFHPSCSPTPLATWSSAQQLQTQVFTPETFDSSRLALGKLKILLHVVHLLTTSSQQTCVEWSHNSRVQQMFGVQKHPRTNPWHRSSFLVFFGPVVFPRQPQNQDLQIHGLIQTLLWLYPFATQSFGKHKKANTLQVELHCQNAASHSQQLWSACLA